MEAYKEGATIKGSGGQQYSIVKLMNPGGMAYAYEARNAGGERVFLKAYNDPVPDPKYCPWFSGYRSTQQEIQKRLRTIKSLAVQTLDEFVWDGAYHQVVEWAPGSDLETIYEKHIKPALEIADAINLAAVTVYTLADFHRQSLVHQDLKFKNFFAVSNDKITMKYEVKIIDFDWSFLADKPDSCKKTVGTFGYLSPEHMRGERAVQASDVFTVCGIMLFELFAGQHPFDSIVANAETETEANGLILRTIESGKTPRLCDVNPARTGIVDKRIQDIVYQCFKASAVDRPKADDVHKVLLSVMTGEKPKARLVLIGGPGRLKWRIGAKTDFSRNMCTQMFAAPADMVSSVQGVLEPNADMTTWYVTPRPGTTNATMVDGRQITDRTELKPGSKVQIGNPASGRIGFEVQVEFENL
jgi:eukaryotic-like serine/threonine-protein kinase